MVGTRSSREEQPPSKRQVLGSSPSGSTERKNHDLVTAARKMDVFSMWQEGAAGWLLQG
jgi:hypothetical protein